MKEPKRRFLLYALIGFVFGIIDWFYLNWLAHISWGGLGESILVVPVIIGMNYGIWLAVFSIKRSGWLGVSLRMTNSDESTIVLIKPEGCEVYQLTAALHGDLEGLFIP